MDVVKSKQQTRTPMWLAIARDWLRTDGPTWLYMTKVLLAAFLSLFVAMRLELPQPRTAMTTVFIVMQAQSGMVFAKSFYRMCGTTVGLIVTLILVGLFPQQPEPFIACLALWIGICTAGAARNRNFRSYGFVLAGYTAALVGVPAALYPEGAFLSAMTRLAEVMLGITCAGAVSALVFPQTMEPAIHASARTRFVSFVVYVRALMAGRMDIKEIESANTGFIADAIGFESSRSMVFFEGPDARRGAHRLARLNAEFMAATTRIQALHQLMERLRNSQSLSVAAALTTRFHHISDCLELGGASLGDRDGAARIEEQLRSYQATLAGDTEDKRTPLANETATSLLDFDTGIELIDRFIGDMRALATTYVSVRSGHRPREVWDGSFVPGTSSIAAWVTGLRTVFVVILLGGSWIATGWPSGSTFTLVGATVCALASSTGNPSRTAYQMAVGTVLAVVAAMIATFEIYPRIDGFPLLCVALVPFLLPGVYMSIRPKWAGYGIGYCIFFCFLAGPDNRTVFRPEAFLNDAVAIVLSMLVASLSYALFAPPTAGWLRRVLLVELRRHGASACQIEKHHSLTRVRSRFESGARDLTLQLLSLSTNKQAERKDTLRWFFAVTEIGVAMIDLHEARQALGGGDRPHAPLLSRVLDEMKKSISELFSNPKRARLEQAISATRVATEAMQSALDGKGIEPYAESYQQCLRQIVSQLHLIRSALLDPHSPLRG